MLDHRPTYQELIVLLQKIDHQLVETDSIHYTDPVTHELEDILEAAGAHYDQRVPIVQTKEAS